MTTKFVQPGEIIDYVAAADIKSNDVIVAGALVGVAVADIAAGDTGGLAIEGVFDLPKVAGAAIAYGSPVAWSVAGAGFTAAAGAVGDVAGGAIAVGDALAADTVVRVKLVPGAGAIVAAAAPAA